MEGRIAIIGIGNLLIKDEGVGVHAIHALRERYAFPPSVDIIDGGTKGLDLLPFIEGCKYLMLVDAVNFSKEPGFIKVIEGNNVKGYLDLKFSVHQIGIPDMIFAVAFKGIIPEDMCLVGIQPKNAEEVDPTLSDVLQGRFEDFLSVIIERLKQWGVEATPIPPEKRIKGGVAYSNVSGYPV